MGPRRPVYRRNETWMWWLILTNDLSSFVHVESRNVERVDHRAGQNCYLTHRIAYDIVADRKCVQQRSALPRSGNAQLSNHSPKFPLCFGQMELVFES